MIPTDPTVLTIIAVSLIVLLVVVGLWVRNYLDEGNAPEATARTSNRIVGVVAGALISAAIAFSSVAELAGVFGEIVSMFPGGTAQLILGGLAVAGFSGYLELSVVAATVIVVIVIFGTSAVRNR